MVLTHVACFAFSLGTAFSENYVMFAILRLLTGFFHQVNFSYKYFVNKDIILKKILFNRSVNRPNLYHLLLKKVYALFKQNLSLEMVSYINKYYELNVHIYKFYMTKYF